MDVKMMMRYLLYIKIIFHVVKSTHKKSQSISQRPPHKCIGDKETKYL